jgi:hypothetical protein
MSSAISKMDFRKTVLSRIKGQALGQGDRSTTTSYSCRAAGAASVTVPRSEIVQGHYSCWNGPDFDDSSPYLRSTFVPEATLLYRIDIEPIRFRDGKMDERRVCGEATFDCICHRGRWVKGADDPHDGVWDKSQSLQVPGGAIASNSLVPN